MTSRSQNSKAGNHNFDSCCTFISCAQKTMMSHIATQRTTSPEAPLHATYIPRAHPSSDNPGELNNRTLCGEPVVVMLYTQDEPLNCSAERSHGLLFPKKTTGPLRVRCLCACVIRASHIQPSEQLFAHHYSPIYPINTIIHCSICNAEPVLPHKS